MAKHENIIYLYGGQGLNNTVFDDMWAFDLENVQWSEQKQPDLVGLVSEKIKSETPGKHSGHRLLSMDSNQLLLITKKTDETPSMFRYRIDSNTWSKVDGDYDSITLNGTKSAIVKHDDQTLLAYEKENQLVKIVAVELGDSSSFQVLQQIENAPDLIATHDFLLFDNNLTRFTIEE